MHSERDHLPAAWHEAGHAVVAALSSTLGAVAHVRIVAGGAGDLTYTRKPAATNREAIARRIYEGQRVLYAGVITEQIATGEAHGCGGDRAKLLGMIERDALL